MSLERLDFMANVFENLSVKEKRKLMYTMKVDSMKVKKGASLIKEIRGDIIGIVDEGTIEIKRTNANGITTVVERLEENDLFGSTISYIDNEEYDIVAKEDASLYFFNYKDIVNYSEMHRAYYQKFMKNLFIIMEEKIRRKNERIQLLTQKTIREKILSYFEIMSTRNNSKTIYLPFGFSELADYLAVNRSALMREIKSLKEEGFIESKNKRIKLLYYNTSFSKKL